MNAMNPSETPERIGFFQLTIVLLSIYVLGALLVQTFMDLSPETDALLNRIDTFICFIFIGDFIYRFHRAPSKLKFLKWGWIDLVSSIPMLDQLRWGRAVRVVRLFRILRAFRSTKVLLTFLFQHRVKSTFSMVVLISLVMMIFASIAILNLEKGPEANIKTPEDALWWACSTIATVGYGDRYPVTTEGRVLAAVLMFTGIGLIGSFTAFVASFFLGAEQQEEQDRILELTEEIKQLRQKIESIEKKLE
jgi:voltage-gated potassium channel